MERNQFAFDSYFSSHFLVILSVSLAVKPCMQPQLLLEEGRSSIFEREGLATKFVRRLIVDFLFQYRVECSYG